MTIKYITLGKLDKYAEWYVVDHARQMFMDPFNISCILLRVGRADTNRMYRNLATRLVEEI